MRCAVPRSTSDSIGVSSYARGSLRVSKYLLRSCTCDKGKKTDDGLTWSLNFALTKVRSVSARKTTTTTKNRGCRNPLDF